MKDWLNQFIMSFGSGEDGQNKNMYRDQRDVVRDFNTNNPGWSGPGNTNDQNTGSQTSRGDSEEESTEVGKSEETGETYEVKVKTLTKKLNDAKEKEWKERELTVTFTSLDEKDKVIHSNIDYLCGGRYATLKNLPVRELAQYFAKEYDKVFKYADASIANYSEVIDPRQAFRLAKSVSENKIISHVDYEKLCSKLDGKMLGDFDNLLAEARIKVAFPISGMKKESAKTENSYYMEYIKDFKEYKTANIHALRIRVSSIIRQLPEEEKRDLLNQFEKDDILKTIF